ncbi:MAG: hypothetical protein LBE13_21050 [Bacteroidales bacterium]|jgi:hypothetical protein|nr:hypothetical protein [Bacteroidales bacterium]
MKLKKFTLLALIGVLILAISSLIYFSIDILINLGVTDYTKIPSSFFKAIPLASFIAWIFIALFFIRLYKNQK